MSVENISVRRVSRPERALEHNYVMEWAGQLSRTVPK